MAMLRYLGRVIRSCSYQSNRPLDAKGSLGIRLAQSKMIPDILSILEETRSSSHHVHGLRLIARALKSSSSQLSMLKDPRYEQVKSEAKKSISLYGPQEINDFCFWLRIMSSFNNRELNPEEESILSDKVDELCSNWAFTSKQQSSLFFDLSRINIYSSSLEENVSNVLKDPNELVEMSEIKQILAAAIKYNHSSSKSVIYSCIDRIRKLDNERLDTADLITLFKMLVEYREKNTVSRISPLNVKLGRIIMDRIETLTESDVLKLLNLYESTPNNYRVLLGSLYKKVESLLEESNSNAFLFKSLVSAGKIMTQQNSNILGSLRQKLYDRIREQLDELNEYQLSNVIYYGFNIGRNFIDSAFLARLKSFPQLSAQNLCMVVSVAPRIDASFDISSLVQDKEKLIRLYERLSSEKKVQALEQLLASRDPTIAQLRSDFLDSMSADAIDSWEKAKNFAQAVSTSQLSRSTLSDLSPMIEDTINLFDSKMSPKTAHSIFKFIMQLKGKDWDQWTSFIDKHAHLMNGTIVDSCIRENYCTPKQINHLLSLVKPSAIVLVRASKMFSISTSVEDTKTFLRVLNNQDQEIFKFLNFRSIMPFLQVAHMKGVTKELSNFLQNLRGFLNSLDDKELKDGNSCRAASFLAQCQMLDADLAKKIIQLNEKDRLADSISDLVIIGGQFPDAISNIEEFKRQMTSFKNLNTAEILIERTRAYLQWPEESMDDHFLESFKEFIQNCEHITIVKLIPLINILTSHYAEKHRNLNKKLLQEYTEQYLKHENKFKVEENVDLLHAFSSYHYFRFPGTYGSILDSVQKNFYKLKNDQKISVIKSITRRGIRQPDIIKNFISDSLKRTDNYMKMSVILTALTELGYQEEDWALEAFEKIMKSIQGKMNLYHGGIFSRFFGDILMFGAQDQYINEAIEVYNSRKLSNPHFSDHLIHDHFAVVKTDTQFKPQLSTQQKLSTFNPFYTFGLTENTMSNLKEILTNNKLEFSEFSTVKDVWAPLYIPTKDTVLWPLTFVSMTYNKECLKGSMQMHKKHLEAAANKVLTFDYSTLAETSNLTELMKSEQLIN